MKYHRIGSRRAITRDTLPAFVLSETADITSSEITELQCLTLTSETALWVSTQNRRIPVRSGYHLISALRFEDPKLQMGVLGCTEVYDVMEFLEEHKDQRSPKFNEHFNDIVRYVFRMVILHSMQTCMETLRELGNQKAPVVYHTLNNAKNVGVSTSDFVRYEGKNLFGDVLFELAKEFVANQSQFLKVDPLVDFALLGSPLRVTKRVDFSSDQKSQPRERVLASLSMLAATKSKTEIYLED